jgi:hypothetical protein
MLFQCRDFKKVWWSVAKYEGNDLCLGFVLVPLWLCFSQFWGLASQGQGVCFIDTSGCVLTEPLQSPSVRGLIPSTRAPSSRPAPPKGPASLQHDLGYEDFNIWIWGETQKFRLQQDLGGKAGGLAVWVKSEGQEMQNVARSWLTPIILATWEAEIRRITVQGQPGQIIQETLSWKYPAWKRAGEVTQVIEHLPSKHQALSSNPSPTIKKKIERKGKTIQTLRSWIPRMTS